MYIQGGTAKPFIIHASIYLKLKSHKIVLCLCHFFEAFKLNLHHATCLFIITFSALTVLHKSVLYLLQMLTPCGSHACK